MTSPVAYASHLSTISGSSAYSGADLVGLERELVLTLEKDAAQRASSPSSALDPLARTLETRTGTPLNRKLPCRSRLGEDLVLDLAVSCGSSPAPVVAGQLRALDLSGETAFAELFREVRLAAFTATDLKLTYGPMRPISSLPSWHQETPPYYFTFWLLRVESEATFSQARALLNSLCTFANGVGALFYRGDSNAASRNFTKLTARELSLEKAIREMAQEIVSARRR